QRRAGPGRLRAKFGASDVVQETFLEAQRIFPRFQGASPDQLRAWLRAILLNKAATYTRSYRDTAKRRPRRDAPSLGIELMLTASIWCVASCSAPIVPLRWTTRDVSQENGNDWQGERRGEALPGLTIHAARRQPLSKPLAGPGDPFHGPFSRR